MEVDTEWVENFVLEMTKSYEQCNNLMDENDNHKCESSKIEPPVDPAPRSLESDKKLGGHVQIKSEIKRESDIRKQTMRIRQTTLFDYFAIIPPEAEAPVKLAPDNNSEKMVNVSLLLSQLLTARVVINRLPDHKIVKSESSSLRRKKTYRYCQSCKTLNIDHTNLTMQKSCSKCGTMLLYVCDKCKVKRYRTYKCVKRHSIRCTSGKTEEKP